MHKRDIKSSTKSREKHIALYIDHNQIGVGVDFLSFWRMTAVTAANKCP